MPTARDVIVAALAVPLPCPVCGRAETCRCVKPEGYSLTEERATLIEAALVQEGHLRAPAAEVSQADLDEAAMYLAARSRHPRYTQTEDGWRKLFQAEPDVEMAYHHATKNAPQSEQEPLSRAKNLLVTFHASRRASREHSA